MYLVVPAERLARLYHFRNFSALQVQQFGPTFISNDCQMTFVYILRLTCFDMCFAREMSLLCKSVAFILLNFLFTSICGTSNRTYTRYLSTWCFECQVDRLLMQPYIFLLKYSVQLTISYNLQTI